MNHNDLQKRLLNFNISSWENEHAKNSYGVQYGILDSTVHFYYLSERAPSLYHVSPFLSFESYVIFSSVKTERDHSEILSIQGLGDLVWILVTLSLLAVSTVSSYIGFGKSMGRESRFSSFAESVWTHTADILNNSVANVNKKAVPSRQLRVGWLLGVTAIINLWCAGLKSEFLVDDLLLIDSLEDLMSNPKLLCYFKTNPRLIKLLEDEDSVYTNLRQQLRRYEARNWQFDEKICEKFSSGKVVAIDEGTTMQYPELFEKLKRKKRKLYVGKTKYEEFYAHVFFNKRLPRDIKEKIDYVATRITETRQVEPHFRKGKFYKQGNLFQSGNSVSLVSFTQMNVVYLTIVFRLWIIGLSLATLTFFFEYFGSERWRKRFCCTIYKICRKIAASLEPYLF